MRQRPPPPRTSRPGKRIVMMGSSEKDLREMPDPVREVFVHALNEARMGAMPRNAKPLQGFLGAGVVEVLEDHDGDTYRAVYTVRFAGVIYVLHAFKKKSKSGVKTPRRDMERIRSRLQEAGRHYASRFGGADPAANGAHAARGEDGG